MKKFLVLLITIFYTTTLFGSYDIKLGVYKNLQTLHAKIAKIKNSKYKKSVVIKKKGRLHYANAIIDSRKEAKDALLAYKKVFKDAFIDTEKLQMKRKKIKKIPKISNKKVSIEPKAPSIPIEKVNNKKIKNPKKSIEKVKKLKNKTNAHSLLQGKTVYMCYDKSPQHLKKRVVKMVFSEKMVNYIPLDNNDTKLEIDYVFEDAKVILNLQDINITHEINTVKPKFLEVSNVMTGTVTYTLRYYFQEKDALDFVTRIKNKNFKTQH